MVAMDHFPARGRIGRLGSELTELLEQNSAQNTELAKLGCQVVRFLNHNKTEKTQTLMHTQISKDGSTPPPAPPPGLPPDQHEDAEGLIVGYMPIRYHKRWGHYMDERGYLGELDILVKKSRGCQGSGSKAKHEALMLSQQRLRSRGEAKARGHPASSGQHAGRASAQARKHVLDWIGLDWIGLYWIVLDWIGLL